MGRSVALGPAATGLGEVVHYLVTGRGRSLAELRTVHDWILRPQLRAVRGVAEVNAWGGQERRVEVRVDPVELRRRGLALQDIAEALRRSQGTEGGGRVVQSGEATLVQGVALLTSLRDVESVVIGAEDGVPIRVRDVASVVEGAELRRGAVTADGRGEAVLGLGFMLLGENSRDVAGAFRARLEEARSSLPTGIEVEVVYDRRTLVDHVLRTVRTNLLEGALLVVVVLLVFLGSARAGLVVASVIPLSMLIAFSAMGAASVAGSLMSLGAIDFGLVVDSAIISVENVLRRLSEDGGRRPVREVVRDAALEVRRPTLFGELVIAIVYLPILALTGVEGRLFRPMALTVLFALAGSAALSLTWVPAVTSLVFARGHRHAEPRLVGALKRAYRPVVGWALRARGFVLAVALLLVVNGTVLASRLGAEFVPRLSEGTIVINTVRLASVDLDESVRYGTRIESALLTAFPREVERVWTRTGTAEVATDPMGVELSDVFITLRPRERWARARTQEGLVRAMQAELADMPGMRMVFTQPIEMRVNEMVAGVRADVGVKVFGDEFEPMVAAANQIAGIMRATAGAADVKVEQTGGLPFLDIAIDKAEAARLGLTVAAVQDVVGVAIGGREAGFVFEGDRRYSIVVRLSENVRQDIEALENLPVPLPAAAANGRTPSILLKQVARFDQREGPNQISREDGKRRVVVTANVRGRDVASVVEDLQSKVKSDVRLPPGYWIKWGGQFENLAAARQRLAIVVPACFLAILFLLYGALGSVRDAVLVFSAVPLALTGGIAALWLTGMPFSVSAAVGFIALSGVAVLNGLVMLTYVKQLRREGSAFKDAIRAGALARLRPVVMTALVAALGFVPMALATGTGAEVQKPLAVVVIGGLISATLLTLVVLPALYLKFGQRRVKHPGAAEVTAGVGMQPQRGLS